MSHSFVSIREDDEHAASGADQARALAEAQGTAKVMNENFVTDLPDGALRIEDQQFAGQSNKGNQERSVCDEVSLTITFLYNNLETKRIVARFDLDSPYFLDKHEKASGCWSLALPYYEMMCLIFTLIRLPLMKVIVRREELITDKAGNPK